jgi:Protein of unknown function (DUF1460)
VPKKVWKALVDSRSIIKPKDARLARKLIAKANTEPDFAQRMRLISSQFIGYPYLINPLVGSHVEPEVFVTRMDGFDCVTFLETVLALAGSRDPEDFLVRLREIRYEKGVVDWSTRLHYTTDWSRYHVRRNFLIDLTRGEETVPRSKRLNFLEGLKSKNAHFRYFPKKRLRAVSRRLADGDLIYFVSTRKGLDVFHVGLIVRKEDRVLMRHAARSRGAVVEQELSEFFNANRMSGFIINRPTGAI